MSRWSVLLSGTVLGPLFVAWSAAPATAQATNSGSPPSVGAQKPKAASPAPAGTEYITVTARLDRLRSAIEPNLGATVYNFGHAALQTLPQGDNTPLNQILLQAPGVAQDSYGQIHVRGDHNEVQFRLDGVQLPEGLSVFGQALEGRFAHSLSLITGALPAQYGFDTAAVVDITTKSGTSDPGGEISIYGGARDYFQPSFSYGGHIGSVDYFITGDFLHNRVGIENPTESFNPEHDLSNQSHGLAHISWTVDPDTRISLLAGVSNEFFQIPNNPNQTPALGLSVGGVTDYDSSDLTEHQREITDFGILSLQKQIGDISLVSSLFSRYSSLYYSPDPIGDLVFDGVSQTAARSVVSTGAQTDVSWSLGSQHTIRTGFQVTGERNVSSTASVVLADGGNAPFTIYDGEGKTGGLYGLYLQDEWHLLPNVTLNYGARFDVVDEFTHENQFSPRVNVVWQPTSTTTLHAGYSRYFTPPPFELVGGKDIDLFNGTSAAAAVTQDSTVKSERDNYYDAGITQTLLPGLQAGLDAYYKQARNLIDEGQFGAPIILSAFNYARGEVHGYEANLTYDYGPISLYSSLSWSRAIGRDIVSSQFNFGAAELAYISQHWIFLDHDQRWSGSGGAAYTLFHQTDHPARLSTDLIVGSGLRASTAEVPNGAELPGYYTINLAATQTLHLIRSGATELRFDVINLLDRRYEIRNGSGVGVGAPQFGLRRTVFIGISQRF